MKIYDEKEIAIKWTSETGILNLKLSCLREILCWDYIHLLIFPVVFPEVFIVE